MEVPTRKALVGSIHRIREFELEKVCLAEEFDILQIVGEGWFGKILLVEHRGTDTEMVLKALPKPYISLRDFYREFHYGLHLGAHKNIITTYDVAFETAGFYVFSQEYAPLGDLTSNVSDTGIGELHTKRVAKQLGAALDHVHARDLVHRDVKLDNILVFKSDFSRIKLCDFGETRKSQTDIRRRNEWLPYSPPEILQTSVEGTYKAVTSHDVWQFGIVIFVCLTGCLPWQKAAFDDPRYVRYLSWYNTSNPLRKQPKLFKLVSSRAQKMFKRFLEPRADKRPPSLGDLHKFIEDRWMAKGINEKNGTAGTEVDELCPSMYSFHSDIDEKNKLLHVLLQHGIETTVDRVAKKARIKDWIQNSVIAEEDENENDDTYGNRYHSGDEEAEPRETLHPIEKNHLRWSSLRYTDEKHINPRTGEVLDKGKPARNNSMTTISYDMQKIQPVAAADVLVKYGTGKDESPSHGSIKDSAYGSLDLKGSTPNSLPNNHYGMNGSKPQYPSQHLSQHLQRQNINLNANTSPLHKNVPLSNNNTNIRNGNLSSSKNSPFSSTEMRNSQITLQKTSASTSTSTLARFPTQSQPTSVQGRLASPADRGSPVMRSFVPMKNSPYESMSNPNLTKLANKLMDSLDDPPMNVVQGQMRINPKGTPPTNNIKTRVMNPQVVHPNKLANGRKSVSKENMLSDPETQESLIKIRQMLVDNKTGLSE